MIHPDLFVGIVAVATSIFILVSAILDWDAVYAMRAPKMIEARWGRSKARMIVVLIGIILLSIGVYLLYGMMGKSDSQNQTSKSEKRKLEILAKIPTVPY